MPAYEFRRGFCTLVYCVSVYASVPALAASASVETSKQRYSRVSLRILIGGFSKTPSVRKLWHKKANMQMSWSSQRGVSAHFRDQRNAGTAFRTSGRATETSCWCNRRKTSEIRIAKATACPCCEASLCACSDKCVYTRQ